jgi:hypothetical protein
MDPYLESQPRWEIFHQWFIHELARLSLPTAVSMGCWIDVERDVYKRDPSGEMVLIGEADDVITFSSSYPYAAGSGGGTATLAPPSSVREVVIDPGEAGQHRQYYLVVRENQAWPRALAVVELLSPANKSGTYARTYNDKRSKLLASLTHFMEIDFLRAGHNPLRALFPDVATTPYFIFVARKTAIGRNEACFPLRLQDELPIVGLPLWGDRPDLPLDLAAAFRSAYDLATGGRPIRYQDEPIPEPPLSVDDASWVANRTGR